MMKNRDCARGVTIFGALGRPGIAALLALPFLVACSSSGSDGEASSGQRLYRQNCALCHGARGEGKPSLGATLQANEFIGSSTDMELVQFIAEGRSADHPLNERGIDMPPRGGNTRLTDEDLARIVEHLRTFE